MNNLRFAVGDDSIQTTGIKFGCIKNEDSTNDST